VDCGRRVQGRHPRQTSNALGAAASQVGPQVLALAADLHTGMGLSLEKVSGLFDRAFSLSITRGGLCSGIQRVARVAAPTYQALVHRVRTAPAVAVDETGWKVAGLLEWLWVFVTAQVTVYAIQPGRGFEQAAAVLGEAFAGRLLRDGWAPYRKFEAAIHQTCLTHLLGRCGELLETATRGAARFPHAVKRLLEKALDLRDRRDQGALSVHGVAVATGRLQAGMDRLLDWHPTDPENRKFLKHLAHERDALFTFLHDPGLPAANWPAEQAIRPAVVTRKVCGGNRTWQGAQTQQIVASLLRTCHQQHRDPYAVFTQLLHSPAPVVAELLLAESNRPPPFRF
jgi:transposase